MESFLKINGITHTRTTPLWPQANGQVERINCVIKKAIQAAINEGRNWKHELDTFLLSYRNTPHCTTSETPSFLLFSRIARDKLPTVPGAEDVWRHDDAVKRNPVQKEKMKTYADMKRRAKSTGLKAGDDVLVKHAGTKDKLTSYWSNDLFTVTKVNGPTIIVRRKTFIYTLNEAIFLLRMKISMQANTTIKSSRKLKRLERWMYFASLTKIIRNMGL